MLDFIFFILYNTVRSLVKRNSLNMAKDKLNTCDLLGEYKKPSSKKEVKNRLNCGRR